MSTRITRRLFVLGLGMALSIVGMAVLTGCSSDKKSGGGGSGQSADGDQADQLPDVVGTPLDAGYFDGGVTMLESPDPSSGEPVTPTSKVFLMAVKFDVPEDATLVPDAYTVVIDREEYSPIGVSFGEARQTFFSLEKFVADTVQLKLGGSDQLDTNDADELARCDLASGEVYLLYRVPGSGLVTVRYGGEEFELRPIKAVALGLEGPEEPVAAIGGGDGEPDESEASGKVEMTVERGELAIGVIDDEETEVYELELTFKCSKYRRLELRLGEDFFLMGHGSDGRGAGRRTKRVFVEPHDRIQLLAGTDYYDNTYGGRDMKELVSGGLAISLMPGKPVKAFFVFPQPPFENGLALHVPEQPSVDLVPAGDVLGEIRPAIPKGVAKIPRAPIIGEPVGVDVVDGSIAVAVGTKTKRVNPTAGSKFLAVEFRIEGNQKLVPRDYTISDAEEMPYYPRAVALGNSAAREVPGDGYETIDILQAGNDDAAGPRAPHRWRYSEPRALILFEVPAEPETFYFSHGSKRLKLTPIGGPAPWDKIAAKPPAKSGSGSAGSATQNPGSKNSKDTSTADKAEQAASRLRLGKLLMDKDPQKARRYFEEAVELAPDSPAGKEARQLLENL